MAKTEATLLLKIKQSGKAILDKTKSALSGMAAAAKVAGAAFITLGTAAVQAAIKAGKFDGVQRSFIALAQSQGQQADKMLAKMKELSQGTVSEMKLMEQANQALLLGLPVDRFGDMLKIAQSSAAATGQSMDFMLNSIVTGLGRGSKLMLDNLGIVFKTEDAYREYAKTLGKTADKLTEAEKKQAFINKALSVGTENAKKAGSGQLTLAQRIDVLKASFEDMTVMIGQAAGPAVEFFAEKITSLFGEINSSVGSSVLISFFQNTAKVITVVSAVFGAVGRQIGITLGGISSTVGNFVQGKWRAAWDSAKLIATESVSNLKGSFNSAVQDMDAIDEKFAQSRIEREQRVNDAKMLKKMEAKEAEKEFDMEAWEEKQALEFERAQMELDLIGATEDQKLSIKQKSLDMQLKAAKTQKEKERIMNEKYQVLEQQKNLKQQELEKKLQEERLRGFSTFYGGLASLQQSSNKNLQRIGKAAAIAQATIDAYLAIQKTLASVPYPANIAAAAGIAVQAFTNVARISGVNFAEGGIVPASQGGTQAIIGEAGRSEAVIPLPDNFDPDEGGGLGGGTTINFYGPVMGNAEQAREMAIMLDQELFKLRQNNESVSFDEAIV